MSDETPAKKEVKAKDPNALPNKVTCSKCNEVWGVRHIVYAKRVAKYGEANGISVPAVTEANLDTIKSDANFIKARQGLDKSYECRVCGKDAREATKKAKVEAKAKAKADKDDKE